jgi:hypothetical protein
MGKLENMIRQIDASRTFAGNKTTGGMHHNVVDTFKPDYDDFLNTDIPNVTYTFSVAHDWYSEDRFDVRGTIYPVNWKSKYSGSDTASNFRTSLSSDVRKGDLVLRDDGALYMIVWEVEKSIDNKKSQAQLCNLNITFERWQEAIVNPLTGIKEEDEGFISIAANLPCIGYEMQNQMEYAIGNNTPGIIPNNKSLLYVQYNSTTDEIQINDQFDWYKNRYKVVDIAGAEIDVTGTFGILTYTCEKVPGGVL